MKLNLSPNLNKAQRNIIVMALAVFACLILFWILIYNPAKHRVLSLEKEYKAIEAEIETIEKVAGGSANLDQAYEKFYIRLKELRKMLEDDPSATVSELSGSADKMRIEVLAIKPEKAQKGQCPVQVKGMRFECLPIAVNIRCDYVTCGEYISAIQNQFEHLLTVSSISMSELGKGEGKLDIWLKLTLYMLRREEQS